MTSNIITTENSKPPSEKSKSLIDLRDLISMVKKLQSDIDTKIPHPSESKGSARSVGATPSHQSAPSSYGDEEVAAIDGNVRRSELNKLKNNFHQIVSGLSKLLLFEKYFSDKIKSSIDNVAALLKHVDSAEAGESKIVDDQLKKLNKEIMKLKHQIPSSLAVEKSKKSGGPEENEKTPEDAVVEDLLTMELSQSFCKSELYDEIKDAYVKLNDKERRCLLCFSVFCENEELKRRMLMYWWAGEGLISPATGETIREAAGEMIETFVSKGLIVPVHKKKLPEAKRFLMTPVVRSAIVKIAEDKNLFSYNKDGSFMAQFEDGNKRALERLNWLKYWYGEEKLTTIFNVNAKFPDLELKRLAKHRELEAKEWLSKMKKLRVLYLGSWRASVKHHMEVASTAFLEGLINMRNLKLLSLQGILRISELTKSIKGLTNLEILDLKSCHNLEVLPNEIHRLKNLTHLDISNCFQIDHMPEGLSSLTKLQVLKGFVVRDDQEQKSCTLHGLSKMKSLIKLTVNVFKMDFPSDSDLKALHDLKSLKKLTLSWGTDYTVRRTKEKSKSNEEDLQLPKNLEKLDILSHPREKRPAWLLPNKLTNLKKLYIRGGSLGDDPWLLIKGEKWNGVERLCLKYLAEIKMNWEQIQSWFPNLSYLEKVDCPLITLCPCDDEGVWVKL